MAQFRKDTNQYLKDGKTIFEVVMLADQSGNLVGPANPSGMAVDAFGRARVSTPLTLFDSYNRYTESDRFNTANSATGSSHTFTANSAVVALNVTTSNNSYVHRETKRVFAYQPGKSLQILTTFVMNSAKTGLRQRVGYFSTENGIYLEQDGTDVYFVKRDNSTGTPSETRIAQTNWNIDKLDGSNTGSLPDGTPILNGNPSGLTLDLSKAQIMFIDIEWLGLGTVRCGFVIDGKLIHCHSFHHANITDGPYMTTACLPVRAEITNTANTASNSTFKAICSTVISEGGYTLTGRPRGVGQGPNAAYTLTTAGVKYPVAAIRLKSERADGIVIPTNFNLMPIGGNGTVQKWELISGATVSGGTWVDAGSDSSVQYNITGTSLSGGTTLKTGYVYQAQQGASPATLGDGEFKLQLERNSFTGTNTTFVLAVSGKSDNDTCVGAIDWEEVT
jgi:hypothetical protein